MEDKIISINCSPETLRRLEEDDYFVRNYAQSITNNVQLVFSSGAPEIEKRSTWSDIATKKLLYLVKENMEKVGKTTAIKTKSKMWKLIAKSMEDIGQTYSPIQVESKFRGLGRQYKKMVLNNKSTGRARVTIPFQTEWEDILGKKKGVNPTFVLGGEISQLDDNSVPDSPVLEDTPKRKPRVSIPDKTLEVLNDMRAEQNQQHKEMLALFKEKEANKEKRAQRKEQLFNKLLEKLN